MDPLNKKERTSVFIKFLVFFLVGIIIVLIPFYFIIQLPEKENRLLTEEYENLEEQLKFQKEYFAVQMDSVKSMLDKFEFSEDVDFLNAELGSLLSEMNKSIVSDTSWRARMYQNIVQTYLDLKKAHNLVHSRPPARI